MTRQNTESMMGRRMMALGMAGLAGWMLSPIRMAAAALQEDLDLVAHIPQMEKREGPLLVFRDFANDPDVEVEQHVRLQLSQRKDLLDRVRQKIGFENRVILSVEDIQVRLMFVPQRQEGHSAAYYRYCLDVTDALFEMNRMDSIYDAIISPKESFPTIPKTGISAFLVHRLAKEYKAICRFTAESGESVTYRITGAIFSNHLGAVDLEIQLLAPGQYGLTRKPYTIWQNDTENLYTLMSVPVEETLHFHLGKATDHQILASMQTDPPENLSAAQRLAQEWMAVEESVVGGLVYRVLASYCARHHMAVPGIGTGETHPAVPSLHQYRYRDRGIELVRNIGFRKAMAMYMDNPLEFRDQLLREDNA
jgi:hypothetical protein